MNARTSGHSGSAESPDNSSARPHSDLLSISEVSQVAGVTARTLRHYQDIGLLEPTTVGAGGIRYYDHAALLRLQQVLILRELDMPLSQIATVLSGERDELAALRAHEQRLAQAAHQLAAVAATVRTTIENLERNQQMSAAELFDGFDADRQAQYEAELIEKYGPQMRDHIAESWQKISVMSVDDATAISQGYVAVELALTELIKQGAAPQDAVVQEVIAQHYAIVCKFWTPNADAYRGLGDMYTGHPDFRARYDAHDPRLAEFFSDAMDVYASQSLTG